MSVATAMSLSATAPAPVPASVDAASARRAGRRQGSEQRSFGAVLASHVPSSGKSHPASPANGRRGAQDRPARQDDPPSALPESACLVARATHVAPPATGHGLAAAASEPAVIPDAAAAGTAAAGIGGHQAPAGAVPQPATATATATAGHDVANLRSADLAAAAPNAAGPGAAVADAAKTTARESKTAQPNVADPKAAGKFKAAQGTVAGSKAGASTANEDVATGVAYGKAAQDVSPTSQAPGHLGKHTAPSTSAATDTTAPAPSGPTGADPATAGPSAPAATVHPGQVAPTTGVPTLSGAPVPALPAAAVPVPVQQQVFAAVGPMLRGDDGSYGVQLQLHPHDLGAVQVTVDVRHGEISVQLHSSDPAAQDALRDGLSDLRRQLEDQGLRTGSMEVGSGGADPRHRGGTRPQPFAVRVAATEELHAGTGPLVPTSAGSTALDLKM